MGSRDTPLHTCSPAVQGYLVHKKFPPLGPYSRAMPRALGGSWGGGQVLMSEVPLYALGLGRRTKTLLANGKGDGEGVANQRLPLSLSLSLTLYNVRPLNSDI